MIVRNLQENLILRTDFMRQNKVILDFKSGTVSIADDLVRVPLQVSNNVQSFVYTVSSVCLQPFTETLVEVQCPRSFAGHDGLIEPISTNQFKHYAVSRSLCHPSLTDGKAVGIC